MVLLVTSCGSSPVDDQKDPNTARYGTWSWDGSKWSQLARTNAGKTVYPDQLFYAASVGGLINVKGTRWNGAEWVGNDIAFSLPEPTNDLPASMVVDEANSQLLFFDSNARTIWAWSRGGWTRVLPPSQWPPANSLSSPLGGIRVGAIAYDPTRHVVLMLSCCSPEVSAPESAIWRTSAWDGRALRKVSESPNLVGNYLVPDGLGHMLAFGPKGFIWDGKGWAPLPSESALPDGVESVAADPAHRQIVAVGQGRSWRWHNGT